MEKVDDLSSLPTYKNRQVILNFYKDDLLHNRDGFHFQSIKQKNDNLTFIKNNGTAITINLKTYPKKYINKEFQNYYTLQNNCDRLEIYFP